jgi:hypothetical protein
MSVSFRRAKDEPGANSSSSSVPAALGEHAECSFRDCECDELRVAGGLGGKRIDEDRNGDVLFPTTALFASRAGLVIVT